MGKLIVRKLATHRDLRSFVGFPYRLYRDHPLWVPPLKSEERKAIDPAKNPVFAFTESAFWLAERDGVIVGRIAGFVNRRDNERRQASIARFGMMDFTEDGEVCAALLEAVEQWAAEQGMTEMEGPLGPGHFDRNCVLIEGFDELPTAVSSYNFPYYGPMIADCGYAKAVDYLEHRLNIAEGPNPRVARISKRVLERKGLRLWEAASKKQLLTRGRELFELINVSYQGLHDFVPLTELQIDFLIGQYLSFIDRRYVKAVERSDGRLVAAGVAMESVSKALQAAGGKLWPFGWVRMLRAMRGNDTLDLYLIAVAPELRGTGLNGVIMHEMHTTAHRRGLRWAETNGELESNHAVNAMWKGYDYRTHKRRRIYRKILE